MICSNDLLPAHSAGFKLSHQTLQQVHLAAVAEFPSDVAATLWYSSYEVTERAPYLGETRAWIGDAIWKPLDRATVEVLVGAKV